MADTQDIVLLVEDEPLLRLAASDMLTDAGFGVVEASNAREAIAILENRTDIRLVFSDIDMPDGLSGLKMAALIRNRWPPIEIVLTSGHVAPEVDALPARCVFFAKPYRSRQIIDALQRFAA